MLTNLPAAHQRHVFVIAASTKIIFVWVVIDQFQKFSVGAKQLKTKREKSGIGVIFEANKHDDKVIIGAS
jgi:PleD family two-component response regulator